MDIIKKTEFQLMAEESAEALWKDFEKTGSIETYLVFVKKTENTEELKPADLTTLS